MKELELRRHAARERGQDALSAAGRIQAEDVGRTLATDFSILFVSPARRAAETVAWFLRGSGQPLPSHAVERGLGTEREDEWREAAGRAGSGRVDAIAEAAPELVEAEAARLAAVVERLFERMPPGARALAVGHTPLIEAAVYGLTRVVVDPLGECEGIALVREEDGRYRLRELRSAPSP